MKETLIVGMALGFIIGAIVVQGNKDAANLVKKGKQAIAKKIQST